MPANSLQLSFNFSGGRGNNYYAAAEFLLFEENFAAVSFLKKFFKQGEFFKAQFPSLIIKGESFCGKTHLLHFFAANFEVEFLTEEKISNFNLASLFSPNRFYILENIDQIKEEELVLHTINSAFEAGSFLIITLPPQTNFKIKDLSSRLKNIFAVEIKNPQLETLKQLLRSGFARQQIRFANSTIDFIANNIDRTYSAAFAAVKLIGFHFSESGKKPDRKQLLSILLRC